MRTKKRASFSAYFAATSAILASAAAIWAGSSDTRVDASSSGRLAIRTVRIAAASRAGISIIFCVFIALLPEHAPSQCARDEIPRKLRKTASKARGRARARYPRDVGIRGALVAVVVVACVASASCVSLVGTTSPEPDAGATSDATATTDGASDAGDLRDSDPSDAAAADAAVDAKDAAVDYTQACVGKGDGKYCNGDQVSVDGGSRDDLIACAGGQTIGAKTCTNGCLRMPSGFPDECDECKTLVDGLYCGDDFVDWAAKNKNTRIRCEGGVVTGNLICSVACAGTGPTASCQ